MPGGLTSFVQKSAKCTNRPPQFEILLIRTFLVQLRRAHSNGATASRLAISILDRWPRRFEGLRTPEHWAGRPAMRVVQALVWLRDILPSDDGQLRRRLLSILRDAEHGKAIRDDLRTNLSALPGWMREIVRGLLYESG
jgi:hypothetical protein